VRTVVTRSQRKRPALQNSARLCFLDFAQRVARQSDDDAHPFRVFKTGQRRSERRVVVAFFIARSSHYFPARLRAGS
jgi:hypothetical protein